MRNAFTGYSYQKQVTFLLLTKMDVEREIDSIEIEAKIDSDFDDLSVSIKDKCYNFQIKDYEGVGIKDLKINNNVISIKGNNHKLSSNLNIIFFKDIEITPNIKILGFSGFKLRDNVIIISKSRLKVEREINSLFEKNIHRKNELNAFFQSVLDKRIWKISRESLPKLKVFITELQEKSVSLTHELLEFENLLLIEGKPGVGKSHFVNTLVKEYEKNILYRFWIGNQDKDYNDRLKFESFIKDLNIKLFRDLNNRENKTLFRELKKLGKTLIIDGLDHVENYNNLDLEKFINFINEAKSYCKIIVLSRPLIKLLNWKKHVLENWNFNQTQKVLKELYHITNYSITDEIFRLSKGYPIIVKYLTEHYKIHGEVSKIDEVKNIDSYYNNIIDNEKGKHSLSLFLCTDSYMMKSEIELFVGQEKYYIEEFVKEHPYLFDIKLNRISLFHDSFNTFLRKKVDFNHKLEKVNTIVSESIIGFNKKFLSRFHLFKLKKEQKKEILIKYADINIFKRIMNKTVDFESVFSFYNQLREVISEFSPNELSVKQYYDLSLIFNLILRDHISTLNTFYYTYVQSLIKNGANDEDITSSEYLFGMYYYIKTKNASLLYNITANDNYGVQRFYQELEKDIKKEDNYIKKHEKVVNKEWVSEVLQDDFNYQKYLTFIIENIYIHKLSIEGYEVLKTCFEDYIKGNKTKGVLSLENFLTKNNRRTYHSSWILRDAYNNLLSYGYKILDKENEYCELTLKEFIVKHSNLGSFDLRDKIHNYIRLALLKSKKIDIEEIYPFWTKYYQRKDYTLYSLPKALKIMHDENLVSLKDCIDLINEIQEVSEKGYRNFLSIFIEFYPPSKIIDFIEDNYEVKDLSVSWFELPTKYINRFSDRTYNIAMNELLEFNRSSSISIEKVKNIFYSNKFHEFEFTLSLFKFKIEYRKRYKRMVEKFQNSKIIFKEVEESEDYDKFKKSGKERVKEGILKYHDIRYIRSKKFKPDEFTKYSDGNYSSLSELDFFKDFTKPQVSWYFKKILYNSLISKTQNSKYFFYLFYHPGNILQLIKLYRNKRELKMAIGSFEKYLELLMFNLKSNSK